MPLVIESLSDKASSVRRYAIAMMTNMILTHPYGAMYGGYLNLKEWEERYQAVKEQLAIVEAKQDKHLTVFAGADQDQVPDHQEEVNEYQELPSAGDRGHPEAESTLKREKGKVGARKSTAERTLGLEQAEALDTLEMANLTRFRLTKRYIADALQFIREIESAMDVVGQLLGSTSKAEVLEAIEFFKVAHEYQMFGASVGLSIFIISRHLRRLSIMAPKGWHQEDAAPDLDQG